MNETPPEEETNPGRNRLRFMAWLVLVPVCFVVVFAVLWINGERGWKLVALSLVLSSVLAVMGTLGVYFNFVRWLFRWRNLRRFLFVAAFVVTLLAVFWTEENWRGKRAWQKHRAFWESKGEKFSLAELAPPPVPDDKNLALAPLLKPALNFTMGPSGIVWRDTNGLARLENLSADLTPAGKVNDNFNLGSFEKGTFADLAAWAAFYRGNTNYPQAADSATPDEVVLTALAKFDPELQELREAAAARPHIRFPLQYDRAPGWGLTLRHLASVKHLIVFLNVRAVAELDAGRTGEAFGDLMLSFRLSDGLSREPILIDHLVRIAGLTVGLQTVREGLVRHAWTDAHLVELENYFGSLDLLAEFKLAMSGELAITMGGLDYLRRQGFLANPIRNPGGEDGDLGLSPTFNAMPSGWYYQNMLTISEIFHDYVLPGVDPQARRVFPKMADGETEALNRVYAHPRPSNIFAGILMPALVRAVQKSARMQTYVDEARVACALERYRLANGQLPEALAVLVPKFIDRLPNDVINGEPLRYRLNSDGGYVLYSVGWNQTDDGGKIVLTSDKKFARVDMEKGDWVWQMPGR